jgi:dihydrofolate reductase
MLRRRPRGSSSPRRLRTEGEESVRKIIASEAITLDGYFTDANDAIDWQTLDGEFNAYSVELLDSVDTLLLGRTTYESLGSYWPTIGESYDPEIARRMNTHRKLVVSNDAIDLQWNNSERLEGDIADALTSQKKAAGKDIALLGSGTLVSNLTELGLIDEYRFILSPIAVGAGRTLFEGIKRPTPFSLSNVRRFESGNILLSYERAT